MKKKINQIKKPLGRKEKAWIAEIVFTSLTLLQTIAGAIFKVDPTFYDYAFRVYLLFTVFNVAYVGGVMVTDFFAGKHFVKDILEASKQITLSTEEEEKPEALPANLVPPPINDED